MNRRPFVPRAYQSLIVDQHLSAPRCATWAGMGLGKTVSTLTALDGLFLAGVEARPALVLAPLRVARNTWPDEAAKWEHLRAIETRPIIGTDTERRAALRDTNANVFTINYDNLPWLMETLGGRWPFGPVIADESTRLKSFRLRQGSKRAQAIAKIAHVNGGATRWVNLTGTPSPNGLQDLWGQTWFLDAGERLGRSFSAFENRWFQAVRGGDGYFKTKPLPLAMEQITDKLRDICLTLDAKDYFDISEPIFANRYVDLPAGARKLYRQMEREMFMSIDGHDVEAWNAGAKTQKCLQLCSGAVYVDPAHEKKTRRDWREAHDVKLQELESVVEEFAGAPILVAYHFKSTLERLLKTFPKGRELDANPQTLRDWNAGKIPLLFAHPKSAGHGLNMQDGGNVLVFFDHDWNLEDYLQIIERIGPTRQAQAGHDRAVWVIKIIARDTLDEDVDARRATKSEIQDVLRDAMKRRNFQP